MAWWSIPSALLAEIEKGSAPRASRSRPRRCASPRTPPLILPLHRELDRAREAAARRAQDRHHRPRHRPGLRGQGRRAAPSASCDLAEPRDALGASSTSFCGHHNSLLRGLGAPELEQQRPARRSCWRWRRSMLPVRGAGVGTTWTRRGPEPASACCSRAREARDAGCRSRHLPLRHLAPTPWPAQAAAGAGLRPACGRFRAGHRQGLHDAGRLAGPSRASCTMTTGTQLGDARARVRHRHRPRRAAAAGSIPRWCARR